MNILVCIKQVPDTTEIRIDPVSNTLIREGVPSIVNTYDLYALEAAARIRDIRNADEIHIVAASMGPESAEAALRECLAVAADEAYLLSGREFAGSDTMATSYALSELVKYIERDRGVRFDAVFCGRQAIDGDTAQVGPELAEKLGIAQITSAETVSVERGRIIAVRETQDKSEVIAACMPCLVTFTKPPYAPRAATIKRKMAARKADIHRISAADLIASDPDESDRLGADPSGFGLKGSPTKVIRTAVPENSRSGIMISGADSIEAAERLAEILRINRLV